MNKSPLDSVLKLISKLTLQQKILLGFVLVFSIVAFIALMFFVNQTNYSTLYTNLRQDDASKVVDFLNNKKIQYKFDNNGTTIKVPKDMVYQVRLELAGQGIPASGVVGYEIFDKSTMGMSDFLQKLNYKRALEGELARTIMQDGIEEARVHIVLPQKSVFKDEEKPPTASIVVKLRGNHELTRGNINAILNLVASSVEGLQPGKVTLIDTKGRLLSKDTSDNSLTAASSKQYEIKQSIENYLATKAQSILDNVLGYGNAIVRVNADLNFDQVEKTIESYDPDSQVAISEQTIKNENTGRSLSDSTGEVSQNNTVNYEINKTIQKVVEGTGNIKRLSIAAVINDIPNRITKDGKTETVYKPRSPEQMKKLEEIIKNAVGLDVQRLDQFSIVDIPFEPKITDDLKVEDKSTPFDINQWINIVLMLAAIIAAIFLLKSLMSRLKNEKIVVYEADDGSQNLEKLIKQTGNGGKSALPQGTVSKSSVSPLGVIEEEFASEGVRSKNQQDKIAGYVSQNPAEAAKLISAWLKEDE